MITFIYRAQKLDSAAIITAEVQAESESAAAKLLLSQGLFPISIKNKEGAGLFGGGGGKRVGSKDRILFTRQLSTLINAGLPLTQSLRTVLGQVNSKALQEVIKEVISSVESGKSLSAAFSEHPNVFSNVYVSLVQAGEASGSLDKSLERIAFQQEKDAAIASKIRGALIYPAIVLCIIVAVVVFMLVTVLPQVSGLYTDLKVELPIATVVLMALSSFIINFWYICIAALGGLFFAGRAWLKTDSGRATLDSFKLNVPIFGKIYRKIYMARFARTLGTMLNTGIPMLESLKIVEDSIGNVHVAEDVHKAAAGVKGGKALSAMLEDKDNFLKLVPQMIKIGEQSGAIDAMLDRVAGYYEGEVDDEVRNLSATIEPIMMVVMGVLVGGVIVAILYPVYSLIGSGSLDNVK